jgi:hypothetical protein
MINSCIQFVTYNNPFCRRNAYDLATIDNLVRLRGLASQGQKTVAQSGFRKLRKNLHDLRIGRVFQQSKSRISFWTRRAGVGLLAGTLLTDFHMSVHNIETNL